MNTSNLKSKFYAFPPWNKLGKKIESLCRKAIYEFDLFENLPSQKLALALSGGKDSLALLFMLHAMRGRGLPLFDLHAIHVHGEFSCGAGVSLPYLQAICKHLNVEFSSLDSSQKKENLECYSCSRKRRKLIFEEAKKVGANHIAFGHHKDDHAQTVLMNLLRQGVFEGMLPKVPMEHYGVTIIRPLIYVEQEALVRFSKDYGFSRISCKCPVGQNSLRKKTQGLIEEISDIFPNARDNLARSAHLYGSKKALNP